MESFEAQADNGEQGGRMAVLEGHIQTVVSELQRLQTVVAQNAQDNLNAQNARNAEVNQNVQQAPPPPPAPLPIRPNLNLPQPPYFSGNPNELPSFKLKLCQFLPGNSQTYFDTESQLMYAGGLLTGAAHQWYMTLVDDYSYRLPPHYDLDYFLQALTDFFGGGITLASRERALDTLRQVGTV